MSIRRLVVAYRSFSRQILSWLLLELEELVKNVMVVEVVEVLEVVAVVEEVSEESMTLNARERL